jgi:hypothetical protein
MPGGRLHYRANELLRRFGEYVLDPAQDVDK